MDKTRDLFMWKLFKVAAECFEIFKTYSQFKSRVDALLVECTLKNCAAAGIQTQQGYTTAHVGCTAQRFLHSRLV